LFGLGLIGRRAGWLDPVPDRLRRACAVAAGLGALGIAGCAGLVALAGVPTDQFFGGWHWAAALTAAAEGLLAATVSVWLLGLAQRHLNRPCAAGSCPYHRRRSVDGATSGSHSSYASVSLDTPRGQSRSTSTRVPSEGSGSSYTRLTCAISQFCRTDRALTSDLCRT